MFPVLPYEGILLSDIEELSWWEKLGDCLKPYSNKQVNGAGIAIRDAEAWSNALEEPFKVIGNWRSSHAYPLQTIYMVLRGRAKRIDPSTITSQRLKRVSSIHAKLARPENRNMKLSTMQDIGGCRAIMKDIVAMRQLVSLYGSVAHDYVQHPKSDGYRSVHIVERYKPRIPKHDIYRGCRIEIQLRSRLQHAFATAVETVDAILGQKLKVGGGDEDWKRFFALASSVIALREDCPPIPDTPSNRLQIIDKLRQVSEKLDAFVLLSGVHLAASNLKQLRKRQKILGRPAAAYILELDTRDPNNGHMRIITYEAGELEKANEDYLNLEKKIFGNTKLQAVLLSVEKVSDLQPAYPNYYLDTKEFIWALQEFIH